MPQLPVAKKLKLLRKVKRGQSVAKVCRQAGISRTVFYQWQKKYSLSATRAKKTALKSQVKREYQHWQATPKSLERQILKLAITQPSLSPQEISKIISNNKQGSSVSPKGAWLILKKHRLNTSQLRLAYINRYGNTLIKESTPDEKLSLIRARQSGESVAKLCQEQGISRPTFYKWYRRYQQTNETAKKTALVSFRPVGEKHWRHVPEAESLVLNLILEKPSLTLAQISDQLSKKEDRPILGNHGVYNLLKRLNLNTRQLRMAYAQSALSQPLPQPQVAIVPSFFQKIIGKIPGLSSVPPPSVSQLLSSLKLFAPFSLVSTLVFFLAFSWFDLVISAPTLSVKLGLFFATLALGTGSFFFLYSMKYYFTLALVLSFSREKDEKEGNQSENANQSKSFFQKLFGLRSSSPRAAALSSSSSPQLSSSTKGFGLQADLSGVNLARRPFVSVHLPMYNEKRVVERLLRACTQIDYPHFEILVCDDSTDETTQIVEEFARNWNKKRSKLKRKEYTPQVKVLHRPTREGFKGGALTFALTQMDPATEFVCVFDADFVPYPDTITQFLKYYKVINHGQESKLAYQQSQVAVVGGYQWHVLNKSENWITRGVRTEYAGSYVIERSGREILGLLKQISGSVYLARADVLKKIGWGTSITEDFELTLKLYEQGYKVAYTPYVQAPAECVSTGFLFHSWSETTNHTRCE